VIELDSVWVFHGAQSAFPSGVFATCERAETWIQSYSLTGMLTQYPLNVGMYDHALAAKSFTPKKPEHTTSRFIGKFSGGGLEHFHYEDGVRCTGGDSRHRA
jgi:hypothetical protein